MPWLRAACDGFGTLASADIAAAGACSDFKGLQPGRLASVIAGAHDNPCGLGDKHRLHQRQSLLLVVCPRQLVVLVQPLLADSAAEIYNIPAQSPSCGLLVLPVLASQLTYCISSLLSPMRAAGVLTAIWCSCWSS